MKTDKSKTKPIMFLKIDNQTITLILLALCIIPVAVLGIWAIIKSTKVRKVKNKEYQEHIACEDVDLEQRKIFYDAFGGEDNVLEVSIEMNRVCDIVDYQKAIDHLEKGHVVIYGGGTGNPYFSTDSAAALRACEISAQAILMAKNGVDGVYDSDPDKNKNAKKYDTITYMEMIEKQLQVMDLTAVSMCKENNIHTVVFNGNQLSNISKVLADETIGTVIK